jgi:hypothetical protein
MTTPIPSSNLSDYITGLARHHGIRYTMTPSDAIAGVITALSGDEVSMDPVEQLLIALERAGVIKSEDVVPLHVGYLREKFGSD